MKTGRQPIARLLGIAIVLHGRFLELGLLAIDDETRPGSEVRADFLKLVTDQSRKLDPQLIAMIEGSPRAAELLPEAQLNRQRFDAVEREITFRAFAENPATSTMLMADRLPENPQRISASKSNTSLVPSILERTLQIEKLPDWNSPDDPRDLKQAAIEGALKKFNETWRRTGLVEFSAETRMEPPEVVPALDGRRWDRARLYGIAFDWVLSGLRPIFFENPRALTTAAWRGYHVELESRDAMRRGGTGGRKARAAGTERDRVKIVDDAASLGRKFDVDDVINRLTADSFVRMATKKWGAKGRRFTEAVKEMPIEQAASEADISPATAFKWLKKLRNSAP